MGLLAAAAVLATTDSGHIAIAVAAIAALPGTYAAWTSWRKSQDESDAHREDVFVKRDDAAWSRMLDAMARSDKDVADLRIELAQNAAELVQVRDRLRDAVAHGERCDANLEEERGHRQRLEADLAALRRRVEGGAP